MPCAPVIPPYFRSSDKSFHFLFSLPSSRKRLHLWQSRAVGVLAGFMPRRSAVQVRSLQPVDIFLPPFLYFLFSVPRSTVPTGTVFLLVGDFMPGKYAQSRNCWENFNRYQFDGVGIYDIPEIKGCDILKPPDLIGFNGIAKCKDRSNKAVHFFLDDYQFMRVWTHPEEQLKRLQKFKYVLSPDFSIYTDFPKALQIYAHFKKHWVAKLWEENDIKVIPTISWGDESLCKKCSAPVSVPRTRMRTNLMNSNTLWIYHLSFPYTTRQRACRS